MWQTPNQKVRAVASARRRDRERKRRPIHIKRISAYLELLDIPQANESGLEVRLILNDLSLAGVGIFCAEALAPETLAILRIEQPSDLRVSAKVIWCQEHAASSRILTRQPHRYRAGLQFLVENPDQQMAIKHFYEEMRRTILYSTNVA